MTRDIHQQIRHLAQRYAVATADGSTHDAHRLLSTLLGEVRELLEMDVAFVSQFVDELRIFEVVSAATDAQTPLVVGAADPLIDTYCKRILDGRLPDCIRDVAVLPDAASLDATTKYRIGSYLSATVRLANGRVFGTVCCFCHGPRHDLAARDQQALQSVADAIARAVEGRSAMSPAGAGNTPKPQ